MPKVTIQVPDDIMALPEHDRDAILQVLAKAATLPETMPIYHESSGEEADIWHSDPRSLLGQAEDDFYAALATGWADTIDDLAHALGLEVQKAIGYDLIKAKNRKLQEIAEVSRKKREQFLKFLQRMNPFTQEQLKKLDALLKERVPDAKKVAEEFITRAGLIGKLRNKAEQEAFEMMGAVVDRFPKTLRAAEKQGITVAKDGRKVTVDPLTPRESRALQIASQQAASKIQEVSDRHQASIRQLVLQAQRERWTPQKLAQALYDTHSDQNRDWRRVAITELAFAANDAYLSGVSEGETVVGLGSANACNHCKRLVIGRTFTVRKEPPAKLTYKVETESVWPGKSNYGRKVAAWVPALPLHPHCRCRWHRMSRFYKVDDQGNIVRKTTAELIQEERARRGLEPDPNLK